MLNFVLLSVFILTLALSYSLTVYSIRVNRKLEQTLQKLKKVQRND